ncbi:polymeric immunoglobulin receptor-like [Indicator indicator]|uniref:polymeric immunoglobulin receptor-like n=1 Tax=Indicator indicator TaxID=1002788 RepID=UPI0023DF79D1|nr:polymeric immunoglobulin receptor-like [Indicator indicator]
MTFLVLIFLLTLLPAQSASSKYLPKSAISSPVFGPWQVYGLLNGSVTITCFYPPTSVNRHDRKYWCRASATSCRTIISTSGYVAAGYEGRASLIDYPESKHFQITISGLTKADEGNYQCGVGINDRGLSHKVSLVVSEGPHVPEGAELFYVELHSTLTMACSFGEESAGERKYLCKLNRSGCHTIIDTYGDIDEDYKGRALLSSKDTEGSFSITITHMDWQDSGFYLCGFGVHGTSGETKELDVHVYERNDVPQGKPTIIAVKGSSATFECHYAPTRSSSLKYWCKWKQNGCSRIIDSSGFVAPLYEGRVALYNNPVNKTFTIILNQLKDSDKGYYWCMTEDEKEQQSSTELKVIDGEPGLQGQEDVEAQVGSQVDLTCSYPCKYYSYQKYWCRWNSTSCIPMPASDQRHPGPDVSCDRDNRTVTLSFDSVTKADQGWYWCGVTRNGRLGETMAVYLSVTEDTGQSDDHNLEIQNLDAPSGAEPGVKPQGRAFSDAGVQGAAGPESPAQSQGPNTLVLSLSLTGAVLLVLVTAFAVFKYRQLKRSDLVSVGSYRTNISMADFESVKGYAASNDACVKENEETQIGGDEFITTKVTPESSAETKKAKRSSREDADLAYSTFLLTSGTITQDGSRGGSSAPEVASPTREGQI